MATPAVAFVAVMSLPVVAAAGGPTGTVSTVAEGPGPQMQPALAEDGAGALHLVYFDAAAPQGIARHRRFTSTDGRWTAPVALAETWGSLQIAAKPSGFYAAWGAATGVFVQSFDDKGAREWPADVPVMSDAWRPGRNVAAVVSSSRGVYVLTSTESVCSLTLIGSDGVAQAPHTLGAGHCAAAGDGQGGLLVVMTRADGPGNDVVTVSRTGPDGASLWGEGGLRLTDVNAFGAKVFPMVAVGTAGALVWWTDRRSTQSRRFGQLLSVDGKPQWTRNGVDLTPAGAPLTGTIAVGVDGVFVVYGESVDTVRKIGRDGVAVYDRAQYGRHWPTVTLLLDGDVGWALSRGTTACLEIEQFSLATGVSRGAPQSFGACDTGRQGVVVAARPRATSMFVRPRTVVVYEDGKTLGETDLKAWVEAQTMTTPAPKKRLDKPPL